MTTEDTTTTTLCYAPACVRAAKVKGLCRIHYARVRSRGTFDLPKKPSPQERFMSYVEVCPESGAWKWTGGISGSGYGAFWVDGKTVLAHRYAYEMANGPIPDGLFVCHKYEELGRDNVNPDHLFLGTAADNMGDAARKKRLPRGCRNGASKLTIEQVEYIASAMGPAREIAEVVGVSEALVCKILRGELWSHTTGIKPCQKHSRRNKSGYRGVSQIKRSGRWLAAITKREKGKSKTKYLGVFDDPIDAAKAYDAAAIELLGGRAKPNFPAPRHS